MRVVDSNIFLLNILSITVEPLHKYDLQRSKEMQCILLDQKGEECLLIINWETKSREIFELDNRRVKDNGR